jgi:hypothetical protein
MSQKLLLKKSAAAEKRGLKKKWPLKGPFVPPPLQSMMGRKRGFEIEVLKRPVRQKR